jgi:NAD(P)H-dependent FMN reductase
VGSFEGITAGNHLRQILAEMGIFTIFSQLPISKVHEIFDDGGKLLDENYERRFSRFLEEFEWYMSALSKQKEFGTPY